MSSVPYLMEVPANSFSAEFPTIPFYVGQKSFGWSLIFMANYAPNPEFNALDLTLRGRILIHGTPEMYIDSNNTTMRLDLRAAGGAGVLTFDTRNAREISNWEYSPANNYNGQLLPEGSLVEMQVEVEMIEHDSHPRFDIRVSSDITIKWVVGARHIVIVDPSFPSI